MKHIVAVAIVLVAWASDGLCATKAENSRLKVIQLPEPKTQGKMSLEQAIAARRSIRDFIDCKLDYGQMGQLAWAGQGITDKEKTLRAAPSAMSLYPVTMYFATAEGLFVYSPEKNSLEQVLNQDVRQHLSSAAYNQPAPAKAPCVIIVAGSERKLRTKFPKQAQRFMLLEAGHIAQNVLLESTSMGLGAVSMGWFEINQVNKICKLPSDQEAIYLICVGCPARQVSPAEPNQAASTGPRTALLIVAADKFRDEELFDTKYELASAGIETVIASTTVGSIKGTLRGTAVAAKLVGEVSVSDYDAVVFIGGTGAVSYFTDAAALYIVQQATQKNKLICAIDNASTIVAYAGAARGRKITGDPAQRNNLQNAGAEYVETQVQTDGPIITASGPDAAKEFGKTIAAALLQKR